MHDDDICYIKKDISICCVFESNRKMWWPLRIHQDTEVWHILFPTKRCLFVATFHQIPKIKILILQEIIFIVPIAINDIFWTAFCLLLKLPSTREGRQNRLGTHLFHLSLFPRHITCYLLQGWVCRDDCKPHLIRRLHSPKQQIKDDIHVIRIVVHLLNHHKRK